MPKPLSIRTKLSHSKDLKTPFTLLVFAWIAAFDFDCRFKWSARDGDTLILHSPHIGNLNAPLFPHLSVPKCTNYSPRIFQSHLIHFTGLSSFNSRGSLIRTPVSMAIIQFQSIHNSYTFFLYRICFSTWRADFYDPPVPYRFYLLSIDTIFYKLRKLMKFKARVSATTLKRFFGYESTATFIVNSGVTERGGRLWIILRGGRVGGKLSSKLGGPIC